MIYLDNGATTPPHPEVLDAFVKVNQTFWGNPNSLHLFGARAEQLLLQSERQILALLNANHHKVIFTSGATESNNLAIRGVCAAYQSRGRHIITTPVEHDAGHAVFEELEKEGYQMTYIDIKGTQAQIVKEVEAALRDDTILVSCMHVNNETGQIFPIAEIGQLINKHPKIKFHVDAVQSVGKIPVDMEQLKIDLLSLSAHKIHGLKGSGALIIDEHLELKPQITGGNQMYGIRSGTVNVAGAVALAKTLRLAIEPLAENYQKVKALFDYTLEHLQKLPGIVINSYQEARSPYIINFAAVPIKGETLVHALEEHNIYISAKSACSSKTATASRILLAMGISEALALESVRMSFSHLNTIAEIDQFVIALETVTKHLKY